MKDRLNRWVLIFILFVLVVAWNYALAEPVARVGDSTAEVILYNDACQLPPSVIRNLPLRVTWRDHTDAGKLYEGCFGVVKGNQVMMYFEDGSVALMSTGSFTIMKGI